MIHNFVHGFSSKGHCSQVETLENLHKKAYIWSKVIVDYMLKHQTMAHHFILCQGSCFVTQEILNASQLLRNSGAPDNSLWDILIPWDHPRIPYFAQIQIHTQTMERMQVAFEASIIHKV